jgi:hypothetical protein
MCTGAASYLVRVGARARVRVRANRARARARARVQEPPVTVEHRRVGGRRVALHVAHERGDERALGARASLAAVGGGT